MKVIYRKNVMTDSAGFFTSTVMGSCEYEVKPECFVKCEEFLARLSSYELPKHCNIQPSPA